LITSEGIGGRVLNAVSADSVRAALGSRFDDVLQRIAIYRASGVQRAELPGLLSDLAAIRAAWP